MLLHRPRASRTHRPLPFFEDNPSRGARRGALQARHPQRNHRDVVKSDPQFEVEGEDHGWKKMIRNLHRVLCVLKSGYLDRSRFR